MGSRGGQARSGLGLCWREGVAQDGVEEGLVHTGIMAPALPCGETKGPEQGTRIEC